MSLRLPAAVVVAGACAAAARGGDCGYAFVTGERYPVSAEHFPDVDHLFTGVCRWEARIVHVSHAVAVARATPAVVSG